jgi:hypothetical protein
MNPSRQRTLTSSRALLGLTALALALAACGEPNTGGPDAGDGLPPPSTLIRVGPSTLSVVPGEVRTLSALLSQGELGPVPDAQVSWRLTKDPGGGTSLAADTSATNENGVADVRVTFGESSVDPVELRADSPGATSSAIWKILVKPDSKKLVIVGSSEITPNSEGTRADVNTAVNRTPPLRVRVENAEGAPVVSERVLFTFVAAASNGAALDPVSGVATTGPTGEAEVILRTGTSNDQFEVQAAIASGATALFLVDVNGVATGCNSSRDCPSGLVCIARVCQGSGGGGTGGGCSGNDRPCPLGYVCGTNGACVPATGGGCEQCPPCPADDPTCVPTGLACNPVSNTCEAINPECDVNGLTCPTGFDCQNGICIPGDGSIDVTGHWFTAHNFNVADGLPGWLRTIGDIVRTFNQALLGRLNVPSFVNRLIQGILNQFIPPWARTLIYIFDSAFELFSQLRAEGEMELAAVGGPRVLSGTENWDSFVFYFLPQCGQNVSGASGQPRACARVDIYTSELPANLAVTVKPFAARVGGDASSGYRILMDKRETLMRLAGLIKYMLDQLIQITTGYESLEGPPGRPDEGALYNLIDCPGLGGNIDDLLGQPGSGIGEGLCGVAVALIGQTLASELQKIVVTQDVLEFAGSAAARTPSASAVRADELGFYPRLEDKSLPADGIWNARFRAGISVPNVPGRWYGSRDPLPELP